MGRAETSWHLWIDEIPRPGWANMAIDTTLLERADRLEEGWLRLYQWHPFCLSFGRHEPATRRYDLDRIQALNLNTVRRPTGGRAVWHAQEVTYAVAAPSLRLGSLQAAYLGIHAMIAIALGRLGIRASLAPPSRTAALDAGACFAQPAGGEVMADGRKVVGSAQYRQGTALLQHGSILLADNQHVVSALTRGAGSASRQPAPEPQPGSPAPWAEVARAVARSAEDHWRGSWDVGSTDDVLREASRHHHHYQSAAWTWLR